MVRIEKRCTMTREEHVEIANRLDRTGFAGMRPTAFTAPTFDWAEKTVPLESQRRAETVSSIADKELIWLGQNTGTHHLGECLSRMHLTRDHVAALLPLLQRFVDTGEL